MSCFKVRPEIVDMQDYFKLLERQKPKYLIKLNILSCNCFNTIKKLLNTVCSIFRTFTVFISVNNAFIFAVVKEIIF